MEITPLLWGITIAVIVGLLEARNRHEAAVILNGESV